MADYTRGSSQRTLYNPLMRLWLLCTCLLLAAASARGERKPAPTNNSAPVTVPMAVDHNQPLIDVVIPRSDGSNMQVRALIDNASPDLWMSRRVAEALGSKIDCDAQICAGTLTSQGPAVYVGEMK